jgi:ATP synthase protein I
MAYKPSSKKRMQDNRSIIRAWGLVTQLALTMMFCMALGILAGYWLDRWLGTMPWLLVVGIMLGFGSSIKSMYTISMGVVKTDVNETAENDKESEH